MVPGEIAVVVPAAADAVHEEGGPIPELEVRHFRDHAVDGHEHAGVAAAGGLGEELRPQFLRGGAFADRCGSRQRGLGIGLRGQPHEFDLARRLDQADLAQGIVRRRGGDRQRRGLQHGHDRHVVHAHPSAAHAQRACRLDHGEFPFGAYAMPFGNRLHRRAAMHFQFAHGDIALVPVNVQLAGRGFVVVALYGGAADGPVRVHVRFDIAGKVGVGVHVVEEELGHDQRHRLLRVRRKQGHAGRGEAHLSQLRPVTGQVKDIEGLGDDETGERLLLQYLFRPLAVEQGTALKQRPALGEGFAEGLLAPHGLFPISLGDRF